MNGSDLTMRAYGFAVMPIVMPRSVAFCLDVVGALAEGGATAVEIVLRSPEALPAVSAVRAAWPGLVVGAGTVLAPAQYDEAVAAGAAFAICPGFAPALARHVRERERGSVPLVPGVVTPSEVMTAQAAGFDLLKFYPAEPSGGTAVLADYANVFPSARFMPSGKIGPSRLADYGALGNVASVGGSWMYLDGGRPLPRADIVRRMREALGTVRGARAGAG